MTAHEKECAFAAIALRIERADKNRDRAEAREWRKLYREIEQAKLEF